MVDLILGIDLYCQILKSNMWRVFIYCSLFLSVVRVYCDADDPVVQTANGALSGRVLKSRNERDYYSFTGVPYAKPPVDELRFKPPVPAETWEGTLDATKEPNMCVQMNSFFADFEGVILGTEDCLYLNVYTPNVNEKLPVMFWIYGGGFIAGHSGPSLYGPEYFMDKDVVLVSINYRVGLFGFASTEDDVMPGNNGMKDQVAALRWVRDNIAKFGGDPDRVTIFGGSAGGASVGYHLLSPLSKGLFHKAILQSGTPLCRWAVAAPGTVRKRTEAIATLAGCHIESSDDVLRCLKRLSANDLAGLPRKFAEFQIYPTIVFPPVVEPCDSNQEAFLCNHPITDFKPESNVPTIVGLNSGEGGLFAADLFNDKGLKYPELNTEFNRLVGAMLMYKYVSLPEDINDIGDKIRQKYFQSGNVDDPSKAVDMFGEGTFLTCVMDMALKLSPPALLYQYDYENDFSFNKLYGDYGKSLGVSHADEIISLFSLKAVLPLGLNEKETEVSKLMIDIWAKFASSETPTIDGKDDGPAWPEFTSIESSLLHIGSAQPNIMENPYVEKYKFWSELPTNSLLEKLKCSKESNINHENHELSPLK